LPLVSHLHLVWGLFCLWSPIYILFGCQHRQRDTSCLGSAPLGDKCGCGSTEYMRLKESDYGIFFSTTIRQVSNCLNGAGVSVCVLNCCDINCLRGRQKPAYTNSDNSLSKLAGPLLFVGNIKSSIPRDDCLEVDCNHFMDYFSYMCQHFFF